MEQLTEKQIRASFANCSKGEAQRLAVPRDLVERPWGDLDFLGWRDPGALDRCYLVTDYEGRPTGIALRFPDRPRSSMQRSMCTICLTTHPGSGVSLMTAKKAGKAGREGNSVGVYMCADLACSLYIRGLKEPEPGGRFKESLSVEEQVARSREKLTGFLAKVLDRD
ncbi:FBP domain-containing protein [Yinghuangia soli]|uniref:FBP domain-containing protein n=1 Tax=Yinghuangia soli TaxID=2908204 RepID=A0AA41Q8B9_9ACTN|nr:FBP domain-containing protein [Yinghuangia soli]MCF2532062.1 FBP domain-containing protein [Yinghuangia soli]